MFSGDFILAVHCGKCSISKAKEPSYHEEHVFALLSVHVARMFVICSAGSQNTHTDSQLSWKHPWYLPPAAARWLMTPHWASVESVTPSLLLTLPEASSTQDARYCFSSTCFPTILSALHFLHPSILPLHLLLHLPHSLPSPYLQSPARWPGCIMGPVVPTVAEVLWCQHAAVGPTEPASAHPRHLFLSDCFCQVLPPPLHRLFYLLWNHSHPSSLFAPFSFLHLPHGSWEKLVDRFRSLRPRVWRRKHSHTVLQWRSFTIKYSRWKPVCEETFCVIPVGPTTLWIYEFSSWAG